MTKAARVLIVSSDSSMGEAVGQVVAARLFRRAAGRLARNRQTPGPFYLYSAYWRAILDTPPENLASLRAALRRVHA